MDASRLYRLRAIWNSKSSSFGLLGPFLSDGSPGVGTKFDRALATVQQRFVISRSSSPFFLAHFFSFISAVLDSHGKKQAEIQRAMPAVTDLVAGFCDGVCGAA